MNSADSIHSNLRHTSVQSVTKCNVIKSRQRGALESYGFPTKQIHQTYHSPQPYMSTNTSNIQTPYMSTNTKNTMKPTRPITQAPHYDNNIISEILSGANSNNNAISETIVQSPNINSSDITTELSVVKKEQYPITNSLNNNIFEEIYIMNITSHLNPILRNRHQLYILIYNYWYLICKC